jgi:putative beta-lysine N-acetyltransferase
MEDKIEKIGNSTIQHGKSNDRVFLLEYNQDDCQELLPELDRLVREKEYTKVVTIIHADELPRFILNGYKVEAYIPRFYKGKTDCVMASKFFDRKRSESPKKLLKTFSALINSLDGTNHVTELNGFKIEKLDETDVMTIAEVLKRIFETYPVPVHDPKYILKTMQTGRAFYIGIWDDGKLIAVSNAEIDPANENVEMTDFAVLPKYRGKNLAAHLLKFMEQEMKQKGIKTAYSIARLAEPGMNKTFLKAGYKYSGTLVNNTNIAGSIESMNIFYKHL